MRGVAGGLFPLVDDQLTFFEHHLGCQQTVDVFERIAFDAVTFDGFHHYDLDFTYAAHLAGFRLGIANDIHILHESPGAHDEKWHHYLARFEQKYASQLHRMPARPFAFSRVAVGSKRELLEVMNGGYQD